MYVSYIYIAVTMIMLNVVPRHDFSRGVAAERYQWRYVDIEMLAET